MEHETLDYRKRLFVDRADIELQENVERVFYQAQKHGAHPVLKQEAAWEKNSGMTASVIFDEEEQVFKAWYMAGFYADGVDHVQCMVTSTDGIHWERPQLGLHEVLGSKDNNIVIPSTYHEGQDHWETMLKDPDSADAQSRYKAIGWSSYDWDGPMSGIYSSTSPDGMNWSHSPEPVFHYHPRPNSDDLGPVGDAQSLMIDTERQRYVAFLRGVPERLMSVSEDFVHWTVPRPFMAPLHEEEGLYNNTGFNYGAHYLGILTHFDKHPLTQVQVLRLLHSRDGESWQRVEGEPLVGLGGVGEWDRFQIMLSGAAPIAVGDKLYIYYRGTPRRHAKHQRDFDPRISADQDNGMAIGLATLRLDGFASINASFDGGRLTTRPFVLSSEELRVNVKADYGEFKVELLDEESKVIPGYAEADCNVAAEDNVAMTIGWKDGKGIGELQGRAVRIRFILKNARLYAYWCA